MFLISVLFCHFYSRIFPFFTFPFRLVVLINNYDTKITFTSKNHFFVQAVVETNRSNAVQRNVRGQGSSHRLSPLGGRLVSDWHVVEEATTEEAAEETEAREGAAGSHECRERGGG